VSNFILQSLHGEDITIYGDGTQTRSFQFVHDLVSGLISLMESDYPFPVNIGNPDEYTIKEFAQMIQGYVNKNAKIIHKPAVIDDPQKVPSPFFPALLRSPVHFIFSFFSFLSFPSLLPFSFVGSSFSLSFLSSLQRKPDITRAKEILGWEPQFKVSHGLAETVEYFKARGKGAD